MSLQAPNVLSAIERVFAEHPEIDTRVDRDEVRGKMIDWVCHALNQPGTDRPWGRKARNRDGSNKNGDALTYLRTDERFEIYDIINGADGRPMWGVPSRSLEQGENGFWAPADPVSSPEPAPVPAPPAQSAPGELLTMLSQIVTVLEELKRGQQEQTAELKTAIADLQQQVQNGIPVRIG